MEATGASDSTVMILTCPKCATSYFVDDARIPPHGRTVKCTSCGERWSAQKPASADPAADSGSAAASVEPAPAQITPGPAPAADSVVKPIGRGKPTRRPGGKALALGAVALALVLAVGAALVFRAQVAKVAPALAPIYAAVGLPVAVGGLNIEDLQAQASFSGGHPVLAVTGQIVNGGHAPLVAAPLRIQLMNAEGKPLATKVARPEDGRVPAGGRRYFMINFIDPPQGVHDLDASFTTPAGKPPAAAAARGSGAAGSSSHAPPPEAHHPEAPQPEEAKPLPPGSPDALQEHG